MAYDQSNTYDTIELFGLTERDAHLPIPEDHILKGSIIRETIETLLGQLRGTGIEAEIEPLAHGVATILQRRKVALGKEVDRTADKIGALAKSHDGSEIAETALEEAQARFLQLREVVGAALGHCQVFFSRTRRYRLCTISYRHIIPPCQI